MLAWCAAAVLTATPAAAHTSLSDSNPANGAVLTTAPASVRLQFDAGVDPALCSVQLVSAGTSAALTVRQADSPDAVSVTLPAGIGAGNHRLLWRVGGGPDGHAATGTVSFTVAAPGPAESRSAADEAPAEPAAPVPISSTRAVNRLHDVSRWLAFVGFAIVLGSAFLVAACRPAHAGRCVRTAAGGAVLLGVATTAVFLSYGPALTGAPLSQALSPTLLGATAATPVGTALLARLGLLFVAGVLTIVLARRRLAGRAVAIAVLAWGASVAATWSAVGHSRYSPVATLMVALDVVHLVAAAVWLGGVATLVMLPHSAVRPTARRFSPIAASSVVVVVASGVIQAWDRVGWPSGLLASGYGRTLVVKVLLVAATLLVALAVRRRVMGRSSAAPGRRGVAVEAALGVTILAVSALLVATPPQRPAPATVSAASAASAASAQPAAAPVALAAAGELVTATVPLDGARGQLVVGVLPTVGPASVHVTTTAPDGQPLEAVATAALRPAGSAGTGQPIRLARLDVGHSVSVDARIPAAGDWELGISVLLPDGTRSVAVAAFSVD